MMNLVFLHGLLGTKSDWQKVIENLPHFRCLSLDLPFHGENKSVAVDDFEQTAQFLEEQIQYTLSLHDALPIESEERRVGKECKH